MAGRGVRRAALPLAGAAAASVRLHVRHGVDLLAQKVEVVVRKHAPLPVCVRACVHVSPTATSGSVDELARGSGLSWCSLQIERRDLRSCVRARLRRGAIQQRLQKQFQRVLCVRAPPAPAFQSTSARARAFNHAFVIRRTHGGRRGVGDLADILIALHHALDARLRAVDREGRGE